MPETAIRNVNIRNIIALGSVSISLRNRPSAIAPALPFRDVADIVEDGDVVALRALKWSYRLADRLFGRDAELAAILNWANDGRNQVAVRLVSGPGGAGKTRLVAEAAQQLRQAGWAAGFLELKADHTHVIDASGRTAGKGLFLALDYPEQRPEPVRDLLARIAEVGDTPLPIRIVLVSRRDHDVWRNQLPEVAHLLGRQELAAVDRLEEADAMALADHVARRLAALRNVPLPSLAGLPAWLRQHPMHGLPLMIIAATVHAVQHPGQAFQVTADTLMDDVAVQELGRLQRLGFPHLDRLVALALLHPAGLDAQRLLALGALETVPGLSGQALLDRVRATPWWQAQGGGRIAPLEPDLPAAMLLRRVLLVDPDPGLPGRIAAATTGAGKAFEAILSRISYDLLRLTGSAHATQSLEQHVLQMLDEAPERSAQFPEAGFLEGTPFTAGFAARVLQIRLIQAETPEGRAAILNNLATCLSDLGQREAALAAAEEAVALFRGLAATQPDAFAPNVAGALNNLANVLSDLGRPEAALAAAQEAVTLFRALTTARPDTFTPSLAMSLNNLAKFLSALGLREAAVTAAEEGLTLYRRVAVCRSEDFSPKIALSLNNFANFLSDLGRPEAALAVAEEAVALYRVLAAAKPDAFSPSLTRSLNNLARFLWELGRREAALAAAQEAVTLYRLLAAARPDTFTPELGTSLSNLANYLSELGKWEAALAAAQEAVSADRALAAYTPHVYTDKLVGSLNTVAHCLSCLGEREAALATAKEAETLLRPLVAARPEACTHVLAGLLNNMANYLSACGQPKAALAAAEEALTLYRPLALARPDAFTPNLAGSLHTLANCMSELGQLEAALLAAKEALELDRALATSRPDAFVPNLAMSLHTLAIVLEELGQLEAALAAAQEAVTLRRSLAAARPDVFTPDLAGSLNNLANYLSALDRPEPALAAVEEAVNLYRALTAAQPGAFMPNLATSLNTLANSLSCLGLREAAASAALEAVKYSRTLAAAQPEAFMPDLAISLNTLALVLPLVGQQDGALAAAEEAVVLYRPLATAQPNVFTPKLALSLGALGQMLVHQNNWLSARDAFYEALKQLSSAFRTMPAAQALLIDALAQFYLEACQKSGSEPDHGLLAPLAAQLARLNQGAAQ